MSEFIQEKERRIVDIAILVSAIGMVAYHLVSTYFFILGGIKHRMLHLTFALIVVFLTAGETRRRRLLLVVLALLSIGVMAYLWVELERLLRAISFPVTIDIIFAFALLILVFWACRLSFGIALPIVATCLLLYGYFGHYLGAPILSVSEIMTTVCLTFGSYDMFGKILGISANVIFLFVVYSALLQALSATDFFNEIAKIIGARTRSGPAMTAVISSALMGTTSGQASPNVAVTGAFTIPLMKKVGYRPEVAGAIEAAASGGGQIMPPIMSAGAFVMAEILGEPYAVIIKMAAVPALLYFFSVGLFVHFHAVKANISALEAEKVNLRRLFATAPLFLISLIVILTLLFMNFPPMLASFWGIASLIILAYLRKDTRPSLTKLVAGFVRGARVGSQVAIACATLGPIIALMTKTGLGMKIGFSVDMWSGGSLLVALIILAFTVIILGLEVPTVAAYLIAAIVAIPALVRLGIDPLCAHMFAFYFGAFSGLTPPVGMSAIIASKLANASYIKTALHSMAAAACAFVIPFVFAYNGALLLLPDTTLSSKIIAIGFSMLGLFFFQMGVVGVFSMRLTLWERTLSISLGAALLMFAAVGKNVILLIAALLFVFIVAPILTRKIAIKVKYGGEVS